MAAHSTADGENWRSLQIGDRIEILRPLDDVFYRGTVASMSDGKCGIQFDDRHMETLFMEEEIWRFMPSQTVNEAGEDRDDTKRDPLPSKKGNVESRGSTGKELDLDDLCNLEQDPFEDQCSKASGNWEIKKLSEGSVADAHFPKGSDIDEVQAFKHSCNSLDGKNDAESMTGPESSEVFFQQMLQGHKSIIEGTQEIGYSQRDRPGSHEKLLGSLNLDHDTQESQSSNSLEKFAAFEVKPGERSIRIESFFNRVVMEEDK